MRLTNQPSAEPLATNFETTSNLELEESTFSSPAAAVIRSMLRELIDAHYSIAQIATSIKMSQATVRRMLQGTTQNPSSRTFDKLLRLYCAMCCTPTSQVKN